MLLDGIHDVTGMGCHKHLAPCRTVQYLRFQILMVVSMKSVNFYQTTQRNNPEDRHLVQYLFNCIITAL
jgi:hypothetical protein